MVLVLVLGWVGWAGRRDDSLGVLVVRLCMQVGVAVG
jgi:hypothetical protein